MVAIEEMIIPKRCAVCKFCVNEKTDDYGSYGQCVADDFVAVDISMHSRPTDCPLVEIGE